MQEEIWKSVPDWEDYYQVSNLGRVRSLDRYCKNRAGSGKQTGRVLKAHKTNKGYMMVSLSLDKKRFHTGVQRLVAKAFIKNKENKEQVNHKNGIKDDNNVFNLEWCTNSENINHAHLNNLIKQKYGEKHHMSKLKNHQVISIRDRICNGETVTEIAKEFKISVTAICNLNNKKTYIKIK